MENFNDSKALAIEIAKILDKKKAHDVRVLKVESLTVLTDYFVIASGTSTTQVASLADEVEYELSQKGLEPYSTEGYDSNSYPTPAPITIWSTCGQMVSPLISPSTSPPTAPLNDSGKQVCFWQDPLRHRCAMPPLPKGRGFGAIGKVGKKAPPSGELAGRMP